MISFLPAARIEKQRDLSSSLPLQGRLVKVKDVSGEAVSERTDGK